MSKKLAYGLYMAEAEGFLHSSKEKKMQNLLRDIRYKYNMRCTELTVNEEYLAGFGLSFDDLVDEDYIRMQKVAETGRLM